MATTDIRLERIKQEYVGLRDAQDALMDKIDTYEAALLGLTEAVSRNSEQIEALTKLVNQNRVRIEILDEKIDRLMTHLDVPPKPPVGFVKC